MTRYAKGQRWISETEPELGLGKVIQVERRHVHILFSIADVTRRYAIESAPIQRVRFRIGDNVQDQEGKSFVVREINEKENILIYKGDTDLLPESELSDLISFSTPKDRLTAGQVDQSPMFDLRYQTLCMQQQAFKSDVRGFIGGRIDLIAHQFYIANELASRQSPRVLLSDETGLGKTIEACLILHRLIISGRVGRVLILLPESLVHQWFVELLRRFNLIFKIYNEELCVSIEQEDPDVNPFLEDQLIICSLDFVMDNPTRRDQIFSTQWDMLIVDEAHHVRENSPTHMLLAVLADKTPRLLLLTATPEQLGQRSHFARLRLLDPDRYFDLEKFQREAENYHRIAAMAGRLLDSKRLSEQDKKILLSLTSTKTELTTENLEKTLQSDPELRHRIIEDLIDRHGIGRVVFRNTRRTIKGFPRRKAHLVELSFDGDAHTYLANLANIFNAETGGKKRNNPYDFKFAPRINWLAQMLREFKNEKVLLICHSVEKALAVDKALEKLIQVKAALFHEEMSLIQRDRNAAWFAETGGARILICSEIGSEGRNFQFAQHLVLFDLPLDPELLEQRIGRLDRIGQASTITIHIPYIRGSVQEVLARWYHEGLNALEKNLPGGHQVMEAFGERVRDLALNYYRADPGQRSALDRLIAETDAFRKELARKLRKGQDRLLELCAFRPAQAEEILSQIAQIDADQGLDRFMLKIFRHCGIDSEARNQRTFLLKPNYRFDDAFPGFRGEKMTVTFDRGSAIKNEQLTFLTWDHPMVTGAMEMLLGSDRGNCAFAIWQNQGDLSILLEAIFVLECVAPANLHADRFLPATPVRVVVNHLQEDASIDFPPELLVDNLEDCAPDLFLDNPPLIKDLFPQMMGKAHNLAEIYSRGIIAEGLKSMLEGLGSEISRLQDLARVNPNIREEEIDLAVQERDTLQQNISTSRLRLDALRLVWKGALP